MEPRFAGQPESYWVNLLTNEDAFLRQSSLAGFGGTNSEPLLLEALSKRDNPITKLGLMLWPKMPVWARTRWPRPVEAALVRKTAAQLLSPVPNYQVLIPILKYNPDPEVRIQMVAGLESHFDNDATRALIEAIDDKDAGVRREAAFASGSFHRDWTLILLASQKAMKSPDPRVRLHGVWIPGGLLDNYDPSVANPAVRTLVPDLVNALHDSDSEVSAEAKDILRRVAPMELQKR